MMNDLVLPLANDTVVAPKDLAAMSPAQLRAELTRSLGLTAENLVRLAWIVRLLEEGGEDLSNLRLGLLTHLRRIAYGQILPELVVRYASSPGLLRYAGALPIPDQSKLARGEPLSLVVRTETGAFTTRMIDPVLLSPSQARQIIGPEGLRDEPEQIAALERSAKPLKPTDPPRKFGKVRADRKRIGIIVGKNFVPASVIIEVLSQLHDGTLVRDEELDKVVAIRLTETEHQALNLAAARAGVSMATLARRALITKGLLSTPEGM